MLNDSPPQSPPLSRLSLNAATELRDHLLVATDDIERLRRLLVQASESLTGHFHGAASDMKGLLRLAARHPEIDTAPLHAAMDHLAGAITSLQFQDMASQLLARTEQRLNYCADRLALAAMGDDQGTTVALGAPAGSRGLVAQDERDTGSVELF